MGAQGVSGDLTIKNPLRMTRKQEDKELQECKTGDKRN